MSVDQIAKDTLTLQQASMAATRDHSYFFETKGSDSSELNEEDLWRDDEGGSRATEEDRGSDDSDSVDFSRFSNLSLETGYGGGQMPNPDVCFSRISPPAGWDRSMRQSTPVNVPKWSEILGSKDKSLENVVFAIDDDDDNNESWLPPHELIARECAKNEAPPFSVHEGVGRTLKGRDLDRVRNAVLKKTGYIDYD